MGPGSVLSSQKMAPSFFSLVKLPIATVGIMIMRTADTHVFMNGEEGCDNTKEGLAAVIFAYVTFTPFDTCYSMLFFTPISYIGFKPGVFVLTPKRE